MSWLLCNNPNKVITRFQFNEIFSKAWMRGMSMRSVISGFKTTGVFPFNPRVFISGESEPMSFNPSSLCEKTGIKYIPLYSPLPKFQRSIQHSANVTFSEEVCRYER